MLTCLPRWPVKSSSVRPGCLSLSISLSCPVWLVHPPVGGGGGGSWEAEKRLTTTTLRVGAEASHASLGDHEDAADDRQKKRKLADKRSLPSALAVSWMRIVSSSSSGDVEEVRSRLSVGVFRFRQYLRRKSKWEK